MWCHGDLHPGNYLVDEQGDLAGVIDFGDLTRGDPAVDCATAWLSFTSAGRATFFEAYCQARGLDDDARAALISRSRGWAVAAFIAPLLTSPLASEQYRALGRYGLSQVLLDDSLT